ncbi:MAG: HGGxSTG domain-containing protein [Waddliaceae bacterium]
MRSNLMRCQAKSKRSGTQCKSWAVRQKRVCRMHGAFGGIKTKEGRQRQVEAVTKHGYFSSKAIEERRIFRESLRQYREVLNG